MVEVFKTNVNDPVHANVILEHLHKTFIDYHANFDLDDCDKILRVKCEVGTIQSDLLICLLKDLGCKVEVLSHNLNPVSQINLVTVSSN